MKVQESMEYTIKLHEVLEAFKIKGNLDQATIFHQKAGGASPNDLLALRVVLPQREEPGQKVKGTKRRRKA